MIPWLGADPERFPPLETALREPDGLLAVGGDLSAERLLAAYRRGIFPWYNEGQPILWWSPDPRAVLLPGAFHLSRRAQRRLRRADLAIRFDSAFDRVVSACAGPRRSGSGTWITVEMAEAFGELHELGHGHSVEVWHGEQLVGGVYGLAIGAVFFGESMFSRVADASKLALAALVLALELRDFALIDCQVGSRHLDSLGCSYLSRQEFSDVLATATAAPRRPGKWRDWRLEKAELLERFRRD